MSTPTNTDTRDRDERLSIGEISAALKPYGMQLSDRQLSQISEYVHVLVTWNKTINLTALEEPLEIVSRHFGESVFAAATVPMSSGRLADVGSGAGFPGLALKIAVPALKLILIEPNHKKCAFLTEVRGMLGLTGVDIFRSRYEEMPLADTKFDFVGSRALGNYRQLLRWAKTALTHNGKSILWLGTDDSLAVSRTAGWLWQPPTPVPNSQRRVIQVGTPQCGVPS